VVGELSFSEALVQVSHTLAGRVDTAPVQAICAQRIREKAAAYTRIDDHVTSLITELVRSGVSMRRLLLRGGCRET